MQLFFVGVLDRVPVWLTPVSQHYWKRSGAYVQSETLVLNSRPLCRKRHGVPYRYVQIIPSVAGFREIATGATSSKGARDVDTCGGARNLRQCDHLPLGGLAKRFRASHRKPSRCVSGCESAIPRCRRIRSWIEPAGRAWRNAAPGSRALAALNGLHDKDKSKYQSIIRSLG